MCFVREEGIQHSLSSEKRIVGSQFLYHWPHLTYWPHLYKHTHTHTHIRIFIRLVTGGSQDWEAAYMVELEL